jgi:hypothetical protein
LTELAELVVEDWAVQAELAELVELVELAELVELVKQIILALAKYCQRPFSCYRQMHGHGQ